MKQTVLTKLKCSFKKNVCQRFPLILDFKYNAYLSLSLLYIRVRTSTLSLNNFPLSYLQGASHALCLLHAQHWKWGGRKEGGGRQGWIFDVEKQLTEGFFFVSPICCSILLKRVYLRTNFVPYHALCLSVVFNSAAFSLSLSLFCS